MKSAGVHRPRLADKTQHLAGAEAFVQKGALGQVADVGAYLETVGDDVEAVDQHASRSRLQEGGAHLDGGALAGAVRPQEDEQLAVLHAQVEAIHGGGAVVVLGDAVEADHDSGLRSRRSGEKLTGTDCRFQQGANLRMTRRRQHRLTAAVYVLRIRAVVEQNGGDLDRHILSA